MKIKIKYWIEFYAAGSFVANTWVEDCVESTKIQDIKWPDNAYALTFNKREDIIKDGKIYKGDSEQVGPMCYHPDSKVETLEEVKGNPNATQILINNMKCNNWDKIIWSRWGNWPQRFDERKHTIATQHLMDMKLEKQNPISEDEAVKLYESKWWIGKTDKEVAQFQLHAEKLSCPFKVFHESIESALNRPVFTHEFANFDKLIEELESKS